MEEVAIKVDSVYKNFKLPHERKNTLKGVFTSVLSKGRKERKELETQHALRDISFDIKKGEFFGIVGRNGSGKSTLLKILAGIYQPNKGSIQVTGKLVPFIELGVGFNPELTGRENVYLNGALIGFAKSEIDDMYEDIVEFAELKQFMDQKLKNYSSGMQVRLAFSMAIRADADILLVDEVLAVGDADFQKKCFEYFRKLKTEKKTVVFVSHDMNAVQEYCDRAILIEKSELVFEGGSYKVANEYTRMFSDQDIEKAVESQKESGRWGKGNISYDSVTLENVKVEKDNPIMLKTKATVKKDSKEAIFGFKIRTNDGNPIAGTNTKLKKKKLHDLRTGMVVEIEWEIQNVFNDGSYIVDVAIESQDYASIYDWWEDAAVFSVKRSTVNTYTMNPIVEVKVDSK